MGFTATSEINEELFNELTESIKQAGKIRKGELIASRRTVITDPNVAEIRKKYNMNQQEFATLLGISVGDFAQLGTME